MSQQLYKEQILPIRSQLYNVAMRMLGDEQDAEDAVQEILLKLWYSVDSLGNYNNVAAFATTVLKNHCLDKFKLRKHNESIDILTHNESTTENPYLLLERKSTDELIKAIVNNLPELQRIILRMKDIEDYDMDEIAEITGSKIDAVRMNLSRARKKVRDEFLRITVDKAF